MQINNIYKALEQIVEDLNQWSRYYAIHHNKVGTELTENNISLCKLLDEAQTKADCYLASAKVLAKALEVSVVCENGDGYWKVDYNKCEPCDEGVV